MELIKVSNIKWDGIDHSDYPDFTDAFICSADYDGVQMTDEQLDEVNKYTNYFYDNLIQSMI